MSPAHPGGPGTHACHCLPAGQLHFLRPKPALGFFLMTRGRQLDGSSRNNSHLQVGRAWAPPPSPGLLHLGRDPEELVLSSGFQTGFLQALGSGRRVPGSTERGVGERGGKKGYTKQASFSPTPPTPPNSPTFAWFTYWDFK